MLPVLFGAVAAAASGWAWLVWLLTAAFGVLTVLSLASFGLLPLPGVVLLVLGSVATSRARPRPKSSRLQARAASRGAH